jgi:hypothetical protein
MKYPAPDGTILESSPFNPVTYTCDVNNISDGTYESYETKSKSDNTLQQIKVVRVVDDNRMTITIIEQTPEQILEYLQNNI